MPGTVAAQGLSDPTRVASSMAHEEATSTSDCTTLVFSLALGTAHLLLTGRLVGSAGGRQAAATMERVVKCKSSPCTGVKCTENPWLHGERW